MGLEAPGYEGGEAAGLFLQAAHLLEVVYPLLEGFAYTEHHGGGGSHAELVCGAMHQNPFVGSAFEASDALADIVIENFRTASRDGIEAGVAEADDSVAHGEVAVFGDGQNFRGGKAVEPDLGKALLDAAEQALEPFNLEVRMQTALHEHAGAAHLNGFGNLVIDGLEIEDVAFAR